MGYYEPTPEDMIEMIEEFAKRDLEWVERERKRLMEMNNANS